jgi:hypothetical protein
MDYEVYGKRVILCGRHTTLINIKEKIRRNWNMHWSLICLSGDYEDFCLLGYKAL